MVLCPSLHIAELTDRSLNLYADAQSGRRQPAATTKETTGGLWPQPAGQNRGERQYSVLIIDDDEDNLLFAQYAVESMGYQATSIRSGDGAVATALTCLPDVILLDILLREDDGVDVLYRLRKHEQIARIPVVAVTALAHPRDRQRIAAAGFSDYLVKPYMIDELAAMIQRHLPQ